MPAARIGILTAGGDCAGLNAVIRGIVSSAAGRGTDVVGFTEGYEGLLAPQTARILGASETRGIEAEGGSIIGSTNKGRFQRFAGAADSCRAHRDGTAAGGSVGRHGR